MSWGGDRQKDGEWDVANASSECRITGLGIIRGGISRGVGGGEGGGILLILDNLFRFISWMQHDFHCCLCRDSEYST